MSVSKTGGPAFPGVLGESGYGNAARVVYQDGSHSFIEHNQGMSLRDYFAGKALAGWLASFGSDAPHPCSNDTGQALAADAYKLADAMLAEREKPQAVTPVDLAADLERVVANYEAQQNGKPASNRDAEIVACVRAVIREKGGV